MLAKIHTKYSDHMTKMAATSIYGITTYMFIYTIAIKLSTFLYDPDFRSNEK